MQSAPTQRCLPFKQCELADAIGMTFYKRIPYTAQMCGETYHEKATFMVALRCVRCRVVELTDYNLYAAAVF